MKYLMSRFGGHLLTIGKGKSSDEELPEDQSLDNMLDNYAKEIIPNYFYISSYDAKPKWMGAFVKLNVPSPVKLGTLMHDFSEISIQYSVTVSTDIYISYHKWTNVYAILIKTHKDGLKYIISDYTESYDYVLQVFIRRKDKDIKLKDRPMDINKILIILFYKMGLIYEGQIESFTPSKTYLGKLINKEFTEKAKTFLTGIKTDESLAELLKKFPKYNEDRV
tara:strand:- start:5813 stop:6478 length:666 start_codon:yes stop_codon:yes gene_type:complete